MMKTVDRLPDLYRNRVNEYGFQIVQHLMLRQEKPDQMASLCQQWRDMRQAEWLATDFFRRG